MIRIFNGVLVSLAALISVYFVLNYVPFETEAGSATHDVALTIQVTETLEFDIIAPGDDITLANLSPGTAVCSSTASVASVTTNAANGYTLGVHDGSATNSALRNGATSVYISDYAGTIAAPTTWTGTGLGVTLFAADTSKNTTQWGAGTTVCDSLNQYAGVPAAATTAHTVTGFRSGADTSSWGWKIDAPSTQETGTYTGNVTFTATTVTS